MPSSLFSIQHQMWYIIVITVKSLHKKLPGTKWVDTHTHTTLGPVDSSLIFSSVALATSWCFFFSSGWERYVLFVTCHDNLSACGNLSLGLVQLNVPQGYGGERYEEKVAPEDPYLHAQIWLSSISGDSWGSKMT